MAITLKELQELEFLTPTQLETVKLYSELKRTERKLKKLSKNNPIIGHTPNGIPIYKSTKEAIFKLIESFKINLPNPYRDKEE